MQGVGQADTPAPGSVFWPLSAYRSPVGSRLGQWGELGLEHEPSCTRSLFLLGGRCRGGRAGGGTLSLELSPGSQDRAGEWFYPPPNPQGQNEWFPIKTNPGLLPGSLIHVLICPGQSPGCTSHPESEATPSQACSHLIHYSSLVAGPSFRLLALPAGPLAPQHDQEHVRPVRLQSPVVSGRQRH